MNAKMSLVLLILVGLIFQVSASIPTNNGTYYHEQTLQLSTVSYGVPPNPQ